MAANLFKQLKTQRAKVEYFGVRFFQGFLTLTSLLEVLQSVCLLPYGVASEFTDCGNEDDYLALLDKHCPVTEVVKPMNKPVYSYGGYLTTVPLIDGVSVNKQPAGTHGKGNPKNRVVRLNDILVETMIAQADAECEKHGVGVVEQQTDSHQVKVVVEPLTWSKVETDHD